MKPPILPNREDAGSDLAIVKAPLHRLQVSLGPAG
jgi:hypothetical protein